MPERKQIPASKVLPLFGNGVPLCWCGAPAEQNRTIMLGTRYPTLCRTHWLSEEELLDAAIARVDAALARHFDKAGQRREEGTG